MLKKLSSDRDPRDTLYSELRRELGPYCPKMFGGIKILILKSPKLLFGFMVALLIASAILSFTVFKVRPEPIKSKKTTISVADSFDKIINTTAKLSASIALKHTIDSISSKKILTHTDSLMLDSALDKLQQLKP